MRERNNLILADFFANRAEQKPDHRTVTFEGGSVRPDETRTYRELFENGNRFAAWLIDRKMAPGDRFATLVANHPEFIESLVGASISATVVVPIDPRTRGAKLEYTLNNSKSRGVVCARYNLPVVAAAMANVPSLDWILVLETDEEAGPLRLDDVRRTASFAEVYDRPARVVDVRLASPMDPLEIIYTSGTTGDPKGVVLPNVRFGGAILGGPGLGMTADDRPYTGLSLTHGNAQMLTFAPAIGLDLPVVFSRKFTKSRLWDITRKYGCTLFNLLGGMATAVYSEPEKPNDADNPVRMVLSAGMPAAIWAAFEKRFGVKVFELYGAIEGGMAMNPPGVGPIGSFGKPPPNLEMKIVDENGNECPPGVLGEIVSRPKEGPAPAVEYFGNPEASKKKTAGGWLHSGDIGHTDANGWFYFDFRKGGGIRHNGDFINPGFVEKVVGEHPMVTDVFVYGVPAASGSPGESDVVAAVVPTDAKRFDAKSVFAACVAGLEPNFVPSYLQVVDEIPKTASEKPQERFLLEKFAPHAPGVYARATV
jgi:crotonobetaine/carnitine-CoA ligase